MIDVGAWVVLRPVGNEFGGVREVAEVTKRTGPWVDVRFLVDGEEHTYHFDELELAALQP